jgi:hypothetical protein
MPKHSCIGEFVKDAFKVIYIVELYCGTRDDGSDLFLSELTTSGDKHSTAYYLGNTLEHLRLLRRVTFCGTDLMQLYVDDLDLIDALELTMM